MQQKEQHTSEKRIYFTVVIHPWVGGISDQFDSFRILHKIGLLLGYSYLHTPLYTYRYIYSTPVTLPWFLKKLYTKISFFYHRYILGYFYPGMYDLWDLTSIFPPESRT